MPRATNNLMRKALPPQQVAAGQEVLLSPEHTKRRVSIPNCLFNFYKTGTRVPVLFSTCLRLFSKRQLFVKTISLVLSFSIIFMSVAPSYAEGVAAIRGSRAASGVTAAVTRAAEEAALRQNPWVRASQMIEKAYESDISYKVVSGLLEGCDRDLYNAGVYRDGNIYGKEVCKDGECIGADVYGQACVGIGLDLAWDGQSAIKNEVMMNTGKNRFEGVSLQLSKMIGLVGVGMQDVSKAYRYEKGILTQEGVCEKADKENDSSFWNVQWKGLFGRGLSGRSSVGNESVKRSRTGACTAALAAMEGLAVIGVMYPSYGNQAAKDIHGFMTAKTDERLFKQRSYAPDVAYTGTLLLMGMNSDVSYRLLEEFLIKQSKQKGWSWGLEVVNYLFTEGWVQAYQESGKNRLGYLNSYTARYNYIDEELSSQWGMRCQPLAIEGVQNEIQCPEGNLYEDIGAYLVKDGKQNPRSAALANKIWEGIKDGGHRYPTPLLVGILTGEKGAWTYEYGKGGADARRVAEWLGRQDFIDMNEGTQRRFKQRMYDAQAKHLPLAVARPEKRDEAKFKRYQVERRAHMIGQWTDLVWAALALGILGYKGVTSVVSHVRAMKGVSQAAATTAKAATAPVRALTKAEREAKAVEELTAGARAATRRAKPVRVDVPAAEAAEGAGRARVSMQPLEVPTLHADALVDVPVEGGILRVGLQTGKTTTTEARAAASQLKTSGGTAKEYSEAAQAVRQGTREAADYSRFARVVQKPSLGKVVGAEVKTGASNWFGEAWFLTKQTVQGLWTGLKRWPIKTMLAAQLMFVPMMPGVEVLTVAGREAKATVEVVETAGTASRTATKVVEVVGRGARSFSLQERGVLTAAREAASGVRTGSAATGSFGRMIWGAPLIAAIPEDLRRLGVGTRQGVQFKTWQDIRQVYSGQLAAYAQQQARLNPQWGLKHYDDTFAILQADKQQEQFAEWQNRQQQYFLNQVAVKPWTLPQAARNAWDAFYLSTLSPVLLRNNTLYQAERNKVKQLEDVWGNELFFSTDILNEIYQAELNFFKEQDKRSLYALGIVPLRNSGIDKLIKSRRRMRLAAEDRRKLQQMRVRVWEAFSSLYVDKMLPSRSEDSNPLLNSDATQAYYSQAVQALEQSDLSAESKKIVLNIWKSKLKSYLQTISSSSATVDMETDGIPVYDSDGQILTYWALDDEAKEILKSLRENQTIYMKLPSMASLAEMWVRTYEDNEHVKFHDTRIRLDIEVAFDNSRKQVAAPTRFGWKKIVEGIMLVNNRIWPLYGIYLMQGFGNVSSTISNFAQTDFTLSNTQMYLMGGISSVIMGVVSFIAGILQTRWSRNADGTVNGTRGRNITMNIGMWSFVAAMLVPMFLGGMYGQLGAPTEWKKYLLMASFFLLGIGAAFIDVSVKPVVLAASPKDKYKPNLGYLSTFKQTVGNVGNYIIPPVVGAIAAFFGGKVDWTMFFPIYGVSGIAIALLYKFSNMRQQTLEVTEKAPITKAPNAKELFAINRNWNGGLVVNALAKKKWGGPVFANLWKQIGYQINTFFHIDELKNNKSDRKIIGHGVAATALHGMNMSILGLYVNQLFKDHVGAKFNMFDSIGADNVFQAVWTSLSQSWTGQSLLFFTVPIILGRYLGTHLMEGKIGRFRFRGVNDGRLLIGSVAAVIAGLGAIAFGGSWPIQVMGVISAALGLTNISPIVGGYTGDRTRHVSDMVSTLLSATAILSFLGNTAFGWFKDLTAASIPWLPLLMPVVGLAYLGYFGWEIVTNAFDKQKKVILDAEHDDNVVAVAPTQISSGDEGYLSREMEMLLENLPTEDLQKLFIGFRGMRNLTLSDIKNVLTRGLEVNQTQHNAIHFTKDLFGGHTEGEFKGLLRQHNDTNLLMNSGAIPFVYSGATGRPVLVGLKRGVTGGIESDPKENCIIFTKDLPIEQLVIFAYLRVDNKNGWYQLELDANGKIKAIPIKDYIAKHPFVPEATAVAGTLQDSATESLGDKDQSLTAALSKAGKPSKDVLLKVWGVMLSGLGLGGLLGGFADEMKASGGQKTEPTDMVVIEQTIDSWQAEKEKHLQQIDQWIYENGWYMSGAATRKAFDDARDALEHASTREEAAVSLAIFEKVQSFQLGKNEQGLLKVAFKGDADVEAISADDFYRVQEMRGGIPAKWLTTKKMKNITPVFFPGGEEQISSFKFTRGIDKIKIRNLLNGLRDKSGLKIRMGAHELGINTRYNNAGYKRGDLHIHFETAYPDEQGIYHSYRVKLEARAALKKHSLDALRATYVDWFGHFLTDTEIPWPEEENPIVAALGKAGEFVKDNPALVWSAVGLAGLGASTLLSAGVATPVLLGALPLLVRKPSVESEEQIELSTATKASQRKGHLVWRILDYSRRTIAYAKYGSSIELKRTMQFHTLAQAIMKEQRFNSIEIHYPKLLKKGLQELPKNILQQIITEKNMAVIAGEIRDADERVGDPFLLSAVHLDGVTLKEWKENPDLMAYALRNKPIHWDEWREVLAFCEAFREKGFGNHTDLLHNLYLWRNGAGKLQVGLVDFEIVDGGRPDEEILQEWETRLLAAGLLVKDGIAISDDALLDLASRLMQDF